MNITLKNGRTLTAATIIEYAEVAKLLPATQPYLMPERLADVAMLMRKFEAGFWTAADMRDARAIIAHAEGMRAIELARAAK